MHINMVVSSTDWNTNRSILPKNFGFSCFIKPLNVKDDFSFIKQKDKRYA